MRAELDRYKPVWSCIYCGKGKSQTTLGQEHIIPFALGGKLVLPRSSCTKCSKLTGTIEGKIIKEMFAPLRMSMKAPTRRPRVAGTTAPVIVQDKSGERTINIPIEDYPFITLIMPQFDLASLVAGVPPRSSNKAVWRTFHANNRAGQAIPATAPIAGPANIRIDMGNFYRFLCKIAHSFAVAEHGLHSQVWLLPPIIAGMQMNYSDVIGGVTSLPPSGSTHMGPTGTQGDSIKLNAVHELRTEHITALATKRNFLTVVIRLLFDFTPEYRLVVAET